MTVPDPPQPLSCNVQVLPPGQVLHRIHDTAFTASSFNPGRGRGSRFAPVSASGTSVPTSYFGSSFDCAVFEYIFHDIDPHAAFKSVSMATVERLTYSELETTRPLRLAGLFEPDLNRWRCTRTQLIDTPPSTYPMTRRWSEAIHASATAVDGMVWTSRKNDAERASMLFGDRVAAADLHPRLSERIVTSPRWLGALQDLADRAGITLTL